MSSALAMDRDHDRGFVFIGEHPALDFANTLVFVDGQNKDLFATWADVVAWLGVTTSTMEEAFRLSASAGTKALRKVVEFRHDWSQELGRLVKGGSVSDRFLDKVNELLDRDPFYETLRRDGKKGFRPERSGSILRGEKRALSLLARQIAVFLANADMRYLRRCANTETCVLYFYDKTKNHGRQWCSVASCGNRHKVAAFRRRQAGRGD